MSFLAFLLLGIASIIQMPLALMPEIDIPYFQVQIEEPGLSALEIENVIVKPLRRQLLQVSGLKDMQSTTYHGKASIRLFLEYGTDTDYAFVELNEKIDRAVSELPAGIRRPRTVRLSPSDIPLFYINIPYPNPSSGKAKSEFSYYVSNSVRKRLEQHEAIAFVDITGIVTPQLVITPNEKQLRFLNLNVQDIENAIKKQNIPLGTFKIKEGNYVYDILMTSYIEDIEDIKNLVISRENAPVKIKDVAHVAIETYQGQGKYYENTTESISMAVIGRANTRVQHVKPQVVAYLEEIKRANPEIQYALRKDQTTLLFMAINNLVLSLALGAILAFIVVFLFIRSFKVSLIVGVVIPVSLIISLLFLYLFKVSINIVSLSGLIVGVGMMIDNAIIVIDNISQYKAEGYPITDACVKGTHEILRPLLSSLLTTCAVFVPLIYLSGIPGILFYDQSLAIIAGLSVSYFVSSLLLPTLYKTWYHTHTLKLFQNRFKSLYTRSFNYAFTKQKLIYFSCILLTIAGTVCFHYMKKEKLPVIHYDDFELHINWNENIGFEKNKTRVMRLLTYLGTGEIEVSNAAIGTQQFQRSGNHQITEHESVIYFKTDTHSRTKVLKERIAYFLHQNFPSCIYRFSNTENLFEQVFTSSTNQLILKIPDNMKGKIKSIKTKLSEAFPTAEMVTENKERVIVLAPRLSVLAKYKVTPQALYNELEFVLGSKNIGLLKDTNTYTPILLKNSKQSFSEILKDAHITNAKGTLIPLKTLVAVTFENEYKSIRADADANFIPLIVKHNDPEAIVQFVDTSFPGNITLGGTYFDDKDFFRELIFILFVTLLLLYFVLAAQFESLVQPVILLLEVPVTIGGTLLLMYLFSIGINLMSMIGLIIMLGIVVNDSILKIDTINKLIEKENISLRNAIHKAGLKRLNAILMTSITTILAMTPILLARGIGADLQRPLALVVIISMVLGTLVSIYLVPLLYWLFLKRKLL